MSLEPDSHRDVPQSSLAENEALIREELATYLLDQDAKNLFVAVAAAIYRGAWERVKPLEHYEEYIRRANAFSPETAELIISLSDPTAVSALNAHVDEFNSRRERFVAEEDRKGAEELLYQRISPLFDCRRPS